MYDFSHRLDRQEYDPEDVDDTDFDAGWMAADDGRAYTAGGGIAIMTKDAIGKINRLATLGEAYGVQAYWQQNGYVRRK